MVTRQNQQLWNSPKWKNCTVGDIKLLKEESEQNRWPMANFFAVNRGNDRLVWSIRLILRISNKVESGTWYLEQLVNKPRSWNPPSKMSPL